MKIVYGERELILEFRENEVQVITIENKEYFSEFLQNLYNQSQGMEGKIIMSEGEKILSLNKDDKLDITVLSGNPDTASFHTCYNILITH